MIFPYIVSEHKKDLFYYLPPNFLKTSLSTFKIYDFTQHQNVEKIFNLSSINEQMEVHTNKFKIGREITEKISQKITQAHEQILKIGISMKYLVNLYHQ